MPNPQDRFSKTNGNRRSFLKISAISSATVAAGTTLNATFASDQGPSSRDSGKLNKKLKITLAGYQYDRTEGLADGRVTIDGCETQFETGKISDLNTHIFSGPKTREVTETGLTPFILAVANENFKDYSLIPVFVLRLFRHKSIFVRTDRGIEKPEDLRGKRVGCPGYSSSSLTWIRGILEHEYGVKPSDMEWIISTKDSGAKATGTTSKQENILPEGISITAGPEGKDESDMLIAGDVDALFHPSEPRIFQERNPLIARMFPDTRSIEHAYFSKTGIFPIMHTVAIRNDVIDANPWLPRAVFNAYSEAKQLAYDAIENSAYYNISLPWIAQEADATRKLMGDNYWPYGIKPNLKTLNAVLQYSHEQGLAKRKLKIEDIFHPSTLELIEPVV